MVLKRASVNILFLSILITRGFFIGGYFAFTINFILTRNNSTFSLFFSALSLTPKVRIMVGEGEPIESALRRFKREVNKSGHLMDLRAKRYFENSQDRKKRKIVQARLRKRLERMQARRLRQQRS